MNLSGNTYVPSDLESVALNTQLYVATDSTTATYIIATDLRSKGLGFNFYCWSWVNVSGKIFIQYCLSLPGSDG